MVLQNVVEAPQAADAFRWFYFFAAFPMLYYIVSYAVRQVFQIVEVSTDRCEKRGCGEGITVRQRSPSNVNMTNTRALTPHCLQLLLPSILLPLLPAVAVLPRVAYPLIHHPHSPFPLTRQWWFFRESLLYLRSVQSKGTWLAFFLVLLPWYCAMFRWVHMRPARVCLLSVIVWLGCRYCKDALGPAPATLPFHATPMTSVIPNMWGRVP